MKRVRLQDVLPLMQEAFSNGQTFTLPVTGGSMQPTLSAGDAVTLREIQAGELHVGDIVFYRRKNGQFVLHRVVDIDENTVDFCGDAQVSVERGVSHSQLIGQVIAYEKGGRLTDLEEIRKEGIKRLRTRRIRSVISWWYRKTTVSHEPTTAFGFVSRYLKKYVPLIVLLCVLSCVMAVSMLGMAITSGVVIDKAFGDMQGFKQWFLVLFSLLIVTCLCNMAYAQLRVRIIARLKNEIREDLVSIILTKQYLSLQELHSGDILNRLTTDIQIVVESAVSLIPQVVSLLTKLLGGLGFMFFVDPLFATVIVVGGVAVTIVVHLLSRRYKKMHKECQEIEGETRSYLQECVENIVVVKSFSNEKGVISKLKSYQTDSFHKQVRRSAYSSVGSTLVYSAFTVGYYTALAWGVLRIAADAMNIGTFVTLLQIMEQIRSPFRSASGLMPQFYSMLASAERLQIFEQLPDETRVASSASVRTAYEHSNAICLKDITFAYPDKDPVFCDFSMTLKKGTMMVLVGASGCGKTTLIKLLLGLLEPQKGTVVLCSDDNEIQLDASTRGLFAYVPQGNMVLSGTIAENLSFGNRDVNRYQMMKAVEFACLSKTIDKLPDGLDTVIGERGVGLSEGQIQRIAIARALLSPSPVLLLDECTSALDINTEKQLIQNLKSLRDRTIIFVSHRTAVLDSADEIIDLQKC